MVHFHLSCIIREGAALGRRHQHGHRPGELIVPFFHPANIDGCSPRAFYSETNHCYVLITATCSPTEEHMNVLSHLEYGASRIPRLTRRPALSPHRLTISNDRSLDSSHDLESSLATVATCTSGGENNALLGPVRSLKHVSRRHLHGTAGFQ